MDYYSKYLKYKNKFIALKNKQIGGVNFCEKENIFDYNQFETIVFDEKKVNEETINIDFIVDKKVENKILIKSKIKNLCNESILEIEFSMQINSEIHAELKYLRSYQDYDTKRLINILLCVCHHYRVKKIYLEDNATFYNPDKSQGYFALIYRIFFNKQSIYILPNTGFQPKFTETYTNDQYLADINDLTNSTFLQWIDFINCVLETPHYKKFKPKFDRDTVSYCGKLFNKYLDDLRDSNNYEFLNYIFGSMINLRTLRKTEEKGVNCELYYKPRKIYDVSRILYSNEYKCVACTDN
jgi:hypothetical protein